MRRWSWWLGGLLLPLALLGHDALMAGVAAAEPVAGDVTLYHETNLETAHANRHGFEEDVSAPSHGAGCDVTRPVIASDTNRGDLEESSVCSSLAAHFVRPAPLVRDQWEEPAWSSRMRRALFRVYRI